MHCNLIGKLTHSTSSSWLGHRKTLRDRKLALTLRNVRILNYFKAVNFLLTKSIDLSSLFCFFLFGKQRGAVMRALASHQCGLGSNPGVDAIYRLSLMLVLSLATRGFSPGIPVFSFPQKPTFPISNSTRSQVDEESPCGCATSKSFFKSLFYFIWSGFHNFYLQVDQCSVVV